MSVRCRSCNYLITDAWGNGCPLCGAPYPSGGGGGGGPGGGGGAGGRNPLYLGLGVVFVLLVGGSLLNRFGSRPDPRPAFDSPVREADSTGRIRVGMPMGEVARVVDADAGRRAGAADGVLVRFPDIETKSGGLNWMRDGRLVTARFVQGRVAEVIEAGGLPAFTDDVAVFYDDDEHPGGDEP